MADGDFEPLDAETFGAREEPLREALLDAQFDFAEARTRTLLILVNGADGAGKGEVLYRLHEWLDPRAITTMAYDINHPDETRRPGGWRYWHDLPERGRIGVVLGSWYHALLLRRATGAIGEARFHSRLERVNRVEAMLAAEGVHLLKIWLTLSADKAAKRFRKKRDGPGGFRRPLLREWKEIDTKKERRRLVEAAHEIQAMPAPPDAPWHDVPASDPLARDLRVGELLLDALRAAPAKPRRPRGRAAAGRRISRGAPVLPALDLAQSLKRIDYKERLRAAQLRLYNLTRSKRFTDRALVCIFEGNDAAGKGGAIRRLRAALDPIQSEVHPIGAPSDEALARPYLWRFWRRIPERGDIAIFDRSWYGRVLVERVEGLAAPADWRRAYDEINDFEHLLNGGGYIVHKFWLAIDSDEQLARFKAREDTPHKRFKITEEDWRNREKWPQYAAAVEDMVALTSTPVAPWTLVEANDKRFARVKVLETLVDRIETALER